MVARGGKSRCESPCFNVHVELDNRALKAKNNGLTQTVAKLQQENAELSKQVSLLQGESFEIRSRYNNLKNVISIIDSTTKSCLPKLNEVVETFTGIIQLCSVASNISGSNRDTRTQAVKPQIVNGHVLHNPTITLSRLDNDDVSYTPPRPSTSRIISNIVIRPGTSRGLNEVNSERNSSLNDSQEGDSQDANGSNGDMEDDTSFICQATRGVCQRKPPSMDTSRLQEDDSEDSDEELEEPLAEEEENEEDQCDQRLTTIEEDEEEEEEDLSSPLSPRSRQRRFLKGRLQEVRIYLNQLPSTCVERYSGAGNISISVSPPERRSSYKQRPSSLIGEPNGSLDNGRSFLDENISVLNRSERTSQENFNLDQSLPLNLSRSKLSVTFKSPPSAQPSTAFEGSSGSSSDETLQMYKTLSPIVNPAVARRSDDSISMPSLTLEELGLMVSDGPHRRTSTPIVQRKSSENLFSRSGMYDGLNRASKSENSFTFKTNITKRKVSSREKKKVAQVLLNRLSTENKLSGSPMDQIKEIVKSPPIMKLSEMRTRSKGKSMEKAKNVKKESVEDNVAETTGKTTKRKKDSPTKKSGKIKIEPLLTPKKSPIGRPKRAARPTTLKEPNLHKKMRRSK